MHQNAPNRPLNFKNFQEETESRGPHPKFGQVREERDRKEMAKGNEGEGRKGNGNGTESERVDRNYQP